MKDKPVHHLPSFAGYLNKVFALRRAVAQLRDARQAPAFSAQSVFLAVFHAFLFGLPSFQQLEAELAQPAFQSWLGVERLLAQLPALYGSRFFDILLLDSLYAQAPLLKLAQQVGWEVVITLRQENRELSQNAAAWFESRPPDQCFEQREEGRTRKVRLWDTEGLPCTAEYPQPVRVLRAEEQVTASHYRAGQLTPETTFHEWMWVTTLEAPTFPARQVWQLGHHRWKNENNGWNDLTQHWAFKHGFLHACKHRPRALAPSGRPAPVPDRGLAAVTLIRCLALALCSAFTLRHSKIVRLYQTPRLEVARPLYRSLWHMQPPARAPTLPAGRP